MNPNRTQVTLLRSRPETLPGIWPHWHIKKYINTPEHTQTLLLTTLPRSTQMTSTALMVIPVPTAPSTVSPHCCFIRKAVRSFVLLIPFFESWIPVMVWQAIYYIITVSYQYVMKSKVLFELWTESIVHDGANKTSSHAIKALQPRLVITTQLEKKGESRTYFCESETWIAICFLCTQPIEMTVKMSP